MPVALMLIVLWLFFSHVTSVGGKRLARSAAPIAGIATVTRHPFLWVCPVGTRPFGRERRFALLASVRRHGHPRSGRDARHRRQAGRASGKGLERGCALRLPLPFSGSLPGVDLRGLARHRVYATRGGNPPLPGAANLAPAAFRSSRAGLRRQKERARAVGQAAGEMMSPLGLR